MPFCIIPFITHCGGMVTIGGTIMGSGGMVTIGGTIMGSGGSFSVKWVVISSQYSMLIP